MIFSVGIAGGSKDSRSRAARLSIVSEGASDPEHGQSQDHSQGHSHDHAGSSCSANGLTTVPAPDGAVMAEPGFTGNVALVTLGCAKNLVDSEVMLGALQKRGFRSVGDPALADLIVVNTCAFLESAVKEGLDTILDLAKYKEQGRCRRLVVAGCMVERYRNDLEASLPEVDQFVSTDEILTVDVTGGTTKDCFDEARRPYFLYDESMPRVVSTGKHFAYLKVAEGCDRPCAFCIIPKIRGSFRSRTVSSVANEAADLLGQGMRELILVAQDLTAYGNDFKDSGSARGKMGGRLSELLTELEKLQSPLGDFWLRLHYAYPIGVTETLVRQIADSSVICKYLDLPLQHISNNVLKGMRRPLGEKGTRGLIEMIRTIAPEIALRTTFITGFPGETDEDVESLRQFISEGHFAHVGIFPYSQESEAQSFTFPNQVEESVREERRKLLMEEQQRVLAERLERFVGQRLQVLVDGVHPESELLLAGRTGWQSPDTDGLVIINEVTPPNGAEAEPDQIDEMTKALVGKFVEVEITEIAGYDLVGTAVSSGR